MPDPKLNALVSTTPLLQEMSIKANSVIYGILGAGLLLTAIFVPTPKGEETAMLVAVAIGVGLLAGSAYAWTWLAKRTAQMRRLLIETPAEIAKMNIVPVRRRHELTYSVDVTTKSGDVFRVNAGTEATAVDLVQRVSAQQTG